MNITLKRGATGLALRCTAIVMAMAIALSLSAGVSLAGNDFPLTSADKISGMKHGERAQLKGHVTPVDATHYTFSDDSGTIPVLMTEIQWQAAHATPEDVVVLHGKATRVENDIVFVVRRANKAEAE